MARHRVRLLPQAPQISQQPLGREQPGDLRLPFGDLRRISFWLRRITIRR